MTTITRLIACVFLILSVVATANAETLMEIYELALQNDPLLREAEANRLATRESRPQARGALLLQIDADAAYVDDTADGLTTSTFSGITRISPIDSESDGWRWSVQLRQTLFRWDQWVRLKQSNKQVAQAEADYGAAAQDLIIRVAQTYFDVLSAEDTLESEQAAKEAIGRQLEQAQKRFEVGLIAITDVQEAQAAFDQAVATEISAKRSLASSREFLREIVGEFKADLASPREEIPLLRPDPADEEVWVETAMQQNLSLQSAELGASIARDDVRVARTGHYPTIDLVASRQNNDTTGTALSVDPITSARTFGPTETDIEQDSIQVQFAVPIFSGGVTSSRVKESVYLHRAAKERFERTARETERQTRDSYLGVISEISRVNALRQARESARTALKATEAGYDVGTRTTVDVLDSRRQLFVADVNYARSRYDYIVNVLLLKQAAGNLSVDDIAEVDSWLEQ